MYPSPFMTCLLIIGIVCLAALPPIGIIFIILAVAEQRRMNNGHRQSAREAAAAHRKREHDAGIRYFR